MRDLSRAISPPETPVQRNFVLGTLRARATFNYLPKPSLYPPRSYPGGVLSRIYRIFMLDRKLLYIPPFNDTIMKPSYYAFYGHKNPTDGFRLTAVV